MSANNDDPAAMMGHQPGAVDHAERRLARGLQFADMMAFTNQSEIASLRAEVQALTELLIGSGAVRLAELEERKKQVSHYFDNKDGGQPKVHLVVTEDKYQTREAAAVDCESRYHLCQARCCKLWFALSVQDLEEGVVRWNYAQPYGIAQGDDGRCVHQDRASGHCGVYEHRPLICRTYSCRDDKRIWLDFENRVINPALHSESWPRGEGPR